MQSHSSPQSIGDAIARIAALARAGSALGEAYLVGGAVRDALLGLPVTELDVASATAAATAAAIADALDSTVVPIGGEYELRRVPLEGGWIDITPLADTLEDDLARRDFTINALALPLAALPDPLEAMRRSELIDRYGSLADLDARLVREVSPTAIADDPLRALRAVRLAATLDLEIETNTERSMKAVASRLSGAPDRVGQELSLLFASERAAAGARLLQRTALLGVCFPELIAGHGVDQRPHHTWDVLEHQLRAAEWVDILLASRPPTDERAASIWHLTWDTPWPESSWGPIREHLEAHASVIRLATLLHDIGKPSTRTVEADGRTRFFHHGPRGADIASARLHAWRFPARTIARVALLLQQHLRPGQIAAPGELPSPRALHRFHRRLGDATPDVCVLFLADSLATAPFEQLLPRWPAYVAHVQRIACWHAPPSARALARIVDGHAVIEATGLPPGPAIGEILEAIAEAAAAGEVTDQAEALALARRLAEELGQS